MFKCSFECPSLTGVRSIVFIRRICTPIRNRSIRWSCWSHWHWSSRFGRFQNELQSQLEEIRRSPSVLLLSVLMTIHWGEFSAICEPSSIESILITATDRLVSSSYRRTNERIMHTRDPNQKTHIIERFLSVGQDDRSAQSIQKGKKKKTTSFIAIVWERRNIGDGGHGKIFISCDDDLTP